MRVLADEGGTLAEAFARLDCKAARPEPEPGFDEEGLEMEPVPELAAELGGGEESIARRRIVSPTSVAIRVALGDPPNHPRAEFVGEIVGLALR